MKIAHLTTVDMSLRYLVLPQLEAARQLGESIGISAPGPHVEEVESRGIRHIPLHASTRGMSLISDLRAAAQLWKILRKEGIDVLHTHNPKPGLYGRVVGRLAGVPIVVNTVHGLYATEDSPLLKRMVVYGAEFVASRFSDMELIQSPEDLELMKRLGLTPQRRTRLLGNGVDLGRFNPVSISSHRDEVRTELGIREDQVLVGMVGRLVAEKGVPELIEAARRLQGDRYVVAIAGPHDPEKDDALSPEVITAGEKAGVRFLGMRTDVERLYAAFDIFVLPSHREGFPRAAMEAAASGLPVLATDIRGCRQVVEPGVNGFLFPVGDVNSLVERIEELGENGELIDRMGKASSAKAATEFDENRVVDRVMTAYADVAETKGLAWEMVPTVVNVEIAEAERDDATAIAALHERMIATGFLSSLGRRFLTLLYTTMMEDESSVVLVARSDGAVVGFIAGTSSTSGLYKRFISRKFFRAVWTMLPALLRPRTWKRVYESLRYGAAESEVAAELLSMAVAPAARRRGVGRRMVEELQTWASRTGVVPMKVVVGAENSGAIALYNATGFVDGNEMEVHEGDASWELVWSG